MCLAKPVIIVVISSRSCCLCCCLRCCLINQLLVWFLLLLLVHVVTVFVVVFLLGTATLNFILLLLVLLLVLLPGEKSLFESTNIGDSSLSVITKPGLSPFSNMHGLGLDGPKVTCGIAGDFLIHERDWIVFQFTNKVALGFESANEIE